MPKTQDTIGQGVAAQIKARAKHLGVPVKWILEAAGVDPSTMYRWETRRTNPTMVTKARLDAALTLDKDALEIP